ncbi:hypothetical protein CC99x_003625 [Candidatus Berkiella cookevillensis]|uniref:Uncharacterized protein n=1 Tax=Candidatus Berkiella cookevillensis TaxID=437022 RepID=A0A0Q9Y9S7_9GAMM|nr:hypothetical protein [Candidatus Berkiella cookevillensis]MCS5707987.1 hypothetical protein [Candidatus Berkiella cookevillensis]
MSNTDEPCLDVNSIIYPYAKTLFLNDQQQRWFLDYYSEHLKSYVIRLVEKEFFAKQKISNLQLQIIFLRQYFSYISRDIEYPSEKLLPLLNGLEHIDALVKDFENACFKNIYYQQHGFTLSSFYPGNYVAIIKKLLQKTLILYMHDKLQQGLINEPDQFLYKENLKWLMAQLHSEHAPITVGHTKDQKNNYKPNLLWYFLNGSNRLPLFLQMEIYYFKANMQRLRYWIQYLSENTGDLKNGLIAFPMSAIVFSLNIIFLLLMPYRFLRTIVNECFYYIMRPITKFLLELAPNDRNNAASYASRASLNILIYGGLLAIFSLPLLPLPHFWLPTILFTPYLALIPLGYLLIVPVLAICVNVYKQEFKSDDEEKISVKMEETIEAQNAKPILYQYRAVRDGLDTYINHTSEKMDVQSTLEETAALRCSR